MLLFPRAADAPRVAGFLALPAGLATWALAQRLEADKQFSLAPRWARKMPKFAPDDERVLRRALTMLDRLRDEFDVEPSPDTVTLVAKIRG